MISGSSNYMDPLNELVIYYINDSHLLNCPQVSISFGDITTNAIIDSGSEVNLLTESIYKDLVSAGVSTLSLPVANTVLVTAFGNKTRRIKDQIYVEFSIGGDSFESVFLVSPQLTSSVILGCDYANEYGIVLDFKRKCFRYELDGIEKVQLFNRGDRLRDVSNDGQELKGSSAYSNHLIVQDSNLVREGGGSEVLGRRSLFIDATEGDDVYKFDKDEENYGSRWEGEFFDVANSRRFYCDSSERRVGEEGLMYPILVQNTRIGSPDPRSLQAVDVTALINANAHLNSLQKESLIKLLLKYLEYLTSKPGMCRRFQYEFVLSDLKPVTGSSRVVPFAVRPIIREQIAQMLDDDILETCNSPFINPITIVYKEGRKPRLCIDARKINSVMVPDRERVYPIGELLQRFNGVRYMTSLDLTSAFLQISLKESSRRFTAFLFDSTVYQFKRVPYGFKNSLSAFVRALKLVLGSDSEEFVVFYVDDLLVFSRSFEDHLKHLNIVIGKLTEAGFTINAAKCRFCQTEVTFLGHIISQTGVSADPERVAAILKYPAPRNQKHLRQFLGTCNFHNRFIINYAGYVGALLPLLKKGSKWKWTTEMQCAFEELRARFAHTIHLVHPNNDLPYAVYTDACKFGISAVLMQTDEAGVTNIVSTASRVLSSAEMRFTTCEQELLAVVYALRKFRLYVFGQRVTLFSDNKALSFLKKCALTSNRITRWVLEIQEYDIDIVHVKGSDNVLADVMSRNPVGLTEEEIKGMGKPRGILVAAINLNIDTKLKGELKNLAHHQASDPYVVKARERLASGAATYLDKYMLRNEVLYQKGINYPYWRPVLPSSLEDRAINFVHTSSGHQGTDRCIAQIVHTFYLRDLGRKVRKYVAHCDICQRVKHPNRSYEVESRSHMPSKPGELMSLDLYGALPTGRGGVKYILVCLDLFSKHVKLYPIKSATTRACLNKLTHYFRQVVQPKSILSDHGTQFTSPSWKKALSNLNISVRYSPIRHPQSNPTERIMRELAKYCRIYCNITQRKWPELIPLIENWLNSSVSGTTGYTPVELMFDEPKPDMFEKIFVKSPDQKPPAESLEIKVLRAYVKMKAKALERKKKRKMGIAKWNPQLSDKVLVRCQPVSNAAQGVTGKFIRPYEGPYVITRIIPPSVYEISGNNGKVRGQFNKHSLKPYLEKISTD